jgi:hypothetical protein
VDERGKKTRVRRAYTDVELAALVAGSGDRGLVYYTAARSGLRSEELRQLTWADVRLESDPPTLRVREVTAKNKKEEYVPVVPELAERLLNYRPRQWSASDRVFKVVPRAGRLARDCKNVGIAFRDDQGRYADFHAFRYTFATFLQRHGIPQRFAMNLMRHSDIKLTAKVYTDESKLPIYQSIRDLPRLFPQNEGARIRAQIPGSNGQSESQTDDHKRDVDGDINCLGDVTCPSEASPVAMSQMERVKGIEPSSQPWEGHILPLNHTRCR